jgi:hypothetical protein
MGSAEQDVGSTKSKAWMLDKKTNKIGDDAAKRSRKRKAGIDTAVNKLVKTEAVQVDELSKGTMGSYVKRATSDMAVTNMAKGMAMSKNKGKMASDLRKDANKRKAGVARAVDKMVKKEAMDPVGKADADIDNDGDTDSTDKYLHNRRKAIRNKMKNKGKGKVGEKAVMHGGKSSKEKEEVSVGEDK